MDTQILDCEKVEFPEKQLSGTLPTPATKEGEEGSTGYFWIHRW